MAATKIGHGLAKGLGIKLDYRHEFGEEPLTRGESVLSVSSADTYVEEEPTTAEYLKELVPSVRDVGMYFYRLFPFLQWIMRYNWQWFIGDLVAGITVGAVVVPQSMSYATLASLPVQFGLYSAFMGVLIYWFFATSKDITIGPVAVASVLTGTIVDAATAAHLGVAHYQVAGCVAVVAGGIICFLGLARLGFIVDFISATAVASFITGAALYIAFGQLPNLMGVPTSYTDDNGDSVTLINTHGAAYLILIDFLKGLPDANINAALGLTALFALYLWRYLCNLCAKKFPTKAKIFFFVSTLRTAVVVLFYTMVSWLSQMNIPGIKEDPSDNSMFKILGDVPRGFQDAGVPKVNAHVISFIASYLPAVVIVLLIEHIAISKSFGRINGYTINPSQELVAIGVTNLLGPFLGAYPATGSFSRTAIKSKAGVRTPLAGVVTAIVVLLAIYALPAVFFWIPSACLSAVIIHAVGDLILPPNAVYQFWRVNPLEVLIFFLGVIVTIFSSIEDGIYTTVAVSAGILLFRLAKARGRMLGKVQVHSVIGDQLIEEQKGGKYDLKVHEKAVTPGSAKPNEAVRTAFLPMNKEDGANPSIDIERPYPGVFIYRFSEGFNYPNANHYLDDLAQTIFSETRRTNPFAFPKVGDRPWNNPGPPKGQPEEVDYSKPTLKAVILDFNSVNNIDVTVAQNLIDVRNQLDRYASPEVVEWHFANVNNRWTKRALVASGFGYPTPSNISGEFHRWKPIYSVAEFGGDSSAAAAAQKEFNVEYTQHKDIETGEINPVHRPAQLPSKLSVVHGINRPFFHLDVWSALQSVIASIEAQAAYNKEHGVTEIAGKSISSGSSDK